MKGTKSGEIWQTRSAEIGSQIYPDFVQVQTVPANILEKTVQVIEIHFISQEFVPPS